MWQLLEGMFASHRQLTQACRVDCSLVLLCAAAQTLSPQPQQRGLVPGAQEDQVSDTQSWPVPNHQQSPPTPPRNTYPVSSMQLLQHTDDWLARVARRPSSPECHGQFRLKSEQQCSVHRQQHDTTKAHALELLKQWLQRVPQDELLPRITHLLQQRQLQLQQLQQAGQTECQDPVAGLTVFLEQQLGLGEPPEYQDQLALPTTAQDRLLSTDKLSDAHLWPANTVSHDPSMPANTKIHGSLPGVSQHNGSSCLTHTPAENIDAPTMLPPDALPHSILRHDKLSFGQQHGNTSNSPQKARRWAGNYASSNLPASKSCGDVGSQDGLPAWASNQPLPVAAGVKPFSRQQFETSCTLAGRECDASRLDSDGLLDSRHVDKWALCQGVQHSNDSCSYQPGVQLASRHSGDGLHAKEQADWQAASIRSKEKQIMQHAGRPESPACTLSTQSYAAWSEKAGEQFDLMQPPLHSLQGLQNNSYHTGSEEGAYKGDGGVAGGCHGVASAADMPAAAAGGGHATQLISMLVQCLNAFKRAQYGMNGAAYDTSETTDTAHVAMPSCDEATESEAVVDCSMAAADGGYAAQPPAPADDRTPDDTDVVMTAASGDTSICVQDGEPSRCVAIGSTQFLNLQHGHKNLAQGEPADNCATQGAPRQQRLAGLATAMLPSVDQSPSQQHSGLFRKTVSAFKAGEQQHNQHPTAWHLQHTEDFVGNGWRPGMAYEAAYPQRGDVWDTLLASSDRGYQFGQQILMGPSGFDQDDHIGTTELGRSSKVHDPPGDDNDVPHPGQECDV